MRLNLAGYKWLWYDGYGRFCLKTTQALIRNGHDVYPIEATDLDRPGWMLRAQGVEFDRATVQLMPPYEMHHLPGRSFCFSMHESTRLPMGWADHVNAKSEWLIVPHQWLIPVFEEAGVKVPIYVVKSGIDPDECQIMGSNRNRPFTFGCLADRGGRKGHWLVYSAFYKAFDFKNKDVRLIMKCRPGSLGRLDMSYSRDSRLTVWRADVDSVADIFSQFDAFMFPTGCEGWGQPPREAAACGVITAATRWSGTDDETDKWAIPLDKFRVGESGMECGGDWAHVDEDELVYWMRWLYENQDAAKARALKGAQWLRENRTYAQSADNLVRTISECIGGPLDKPDPVLSQEDILTTRKSLAALPEFLTGDEPDEDANATPRKKVRANGHLKEVIR